MPLKKRSVYLMQKFKRLENKFEFSHNSDRDASIKNLVGSITKNGGQHAENDMDKIIEN